LENGRGPYKTESLGIIKGRLRINNFTRIGESGALRKKQKVS